MHQTERTKAPPGHLGYGTHRGRPSVSSGFRQIVSHMLVWYGYYLPYHRGKWRVVDKAIKVFRLQGEPAGPVTARRHGFWFELDTRYYIHRSIYYLGAHEGWDTRFVETAVLPGWVVCDVGANIGWYTLVAAIAMQGVGSVHAFEPAPDEFQRLRRNVELNGLVNVALYPVAMSDRPGDVWLTETRDAGTTRLATSNDEATRMVRATTLDSFVHDVGLNRLDLLKVDVEGAELRLLYGARESLRWFRPAVVIELCPHNLTKFNGTVQEVIKVLEDLGYAIYRSRPRGLRRLREVPAQGRFFNAVAIPRESVDRKTVSWSQVRKWAEDRMSWAAGAAPTREG